MGIEELRLRLSTIATLAIPPTRSIGVQSGTTSTFDGNSSSRYLKQRSIPFLIPPSSLALKNDLWCLVSTVRERKAR